MRSRVSKFAGVLMAASSMAFLMGGCPLDGDNIEDIIEDIADALDNEIGIFQSRDPRIVTLPQPIVDRGDTVIINNNVTIIDNPRQDLVVDVLPDVVLIGFENLTGLDGFYTYFVDGIEQSIFVFDGETLLLEYPCVDTIELAFEEYYDFDGFFVDEFVINDGFFENPFDFTCGEALIFTFDQDGVFSEVTPIDLVQ
ncbi:MAG: hypothetical protein AB7N71_10140 [Phycisphaerae bacterium]